MIVLDASATIDWLLPTPAGLRIEQLIYERDEAIYAPELLDLEVAQVLRRFVREKSISAVRGEEALRDLRLARVRRCPHGMLLPRIWKLRDNLTAYDAAYVSLAEALNATLVTRDRKVSAAPGHRARVKII